MERSSDTKLVMDTFFRRGIKKFFKHIVYYVMKNNTIRSRLLLCLIAALSVFLRLCQFPSLPTGLQPDEVSAAYQSYALLQHGTDLWGNRWPVYFIGSETGQSVLLSYLNVPFIKLFGLTAFGIRLSSVLLSLLTIGIFYLFVKRWYGARAALIAAFLLGTSPWHIMMSRWSLDANLLPCFLLLGIASLSYCYTAKNSRILIPFSLMFMAIAFYTYILSIVIIPTFLVLYFGFIGLEAKLRNGKIIWKNKFSILISFLIFLLIALPFLPFILDNYILHRTPSFVQHLPFTVPLLFNGGFAGIATGQNVLAANVQFLVSGFNDGQVWNMAGGYAPLGLLSLLLVALGIYYSVRTWQVHTNLFLIWLVAMIPLFFLIPLNIVRANAAFLPLIALSAIGISGIYDSLAKKKSDDEPEMLASGNADGGPEEFPTYASAVPPQVAVVLLLLVALSIYNGLFCYYYFTNYNNDISVISNAGLGTALMQATSSANRNEPIYVSDQVNDNDLYTVLLLKVNPADFREYSYVFISNGAYQVRSYKHYYFSHNDPELNRNPSFIAIVKQYEWLPCAYGLLMYLDKGWTIERCFNGLARHL